MGKVPVAWVDVEEAVEGERLTYTEVRLGPLTQGHYLISYPLELHGEVAEALKALPVDERVVVRNAANEG
jgi:hypothetical protein